MKVNIKMNSLLFDCKAYNPTMDICEVVGFHRNKEQGLVLVSLLLDNGKVRDYLLNDIKLLPFSGMKDKKGNKIYHQDIIKMDYEIPIGVDEDYSGFRYKRKLVYVYGLVNVNYNDKNGIFIKVNNLSKQYDNPFYDYMGCKFSSIYDFEVIGNIDYLNSISDGDIFEG